ncbi:MAG: DUF4258 domain-containing protein, partial [Flavihumibacter sp.]
RLIAEVSEKLSLQPSVWKATDLFSAIGAQRYVDLAMRTTPRLPAPVKRITLVIIALFIIALSFYRQRNRAPAGRDDGALNRHPAELVYTKHARCRMGCREVTETEVRDILENGKINPAKSDPADKPCPSFALEGYSKTDNQHLRIVFGQCGATTKVITCIDLDRDFTCNCN